MKVLSLTQPWASLVVYGLKRYETRSWSTNYRGPLAIHASQGYPRWAREFSETLVPRILSHSYDAIPVAFDPLNLPRGVIIGRVRLVDCIRVEELPELPFIEDQFGNYNSGRYAWELADPVIFKEPIPAKGALGLWEWNAEVA